MYHPIASAFPFIQDLALFRAGVGEKEEIRYMTQANGYMVVSYVVSGESTFDNVYAAECRGIVFDQHGKIAARPLTKFFNLNERPGARPEDFDWSKLTRVMDKRDGSMIHTVAMPEGEGMEVAPSMIAPHGYNAAFTLKSKKSFESDVAVQAREWMSMRQNFVDFCNRVIDMGCTAIFEWTSPTARIVLPYHEDGLTLLHVRDNATGRYWSPGEMLHHAETHQVPVVASNAVAPEQQNLFEQLISEMLGDGNPNRDPKQVLATVQKLQEVMTDIEGWVFQFNDGQMVKVKTKWYMERHRAMTFLRERDIVGAVLNESLDDLKALLVGEGVDISEIIMIEERTVQEIRVIEQIIDRAMEIIKTQGYDKKAAALTYGPRGVGHPYFGLIMNKMDGREPDIKTWYERNVMPTIPLRQLNLLQSVAEAE